MTSAADIDTRIQAIDARPDAPEALVERMAAALWQAAGGDVRWVALAHDSWMRKRYRALAAAALRVVTEPADGSL